VFEIPTDASFTGAGAGYEYLREGISQINSREGTRYDLTFLHLDAVRYGVPQQRQHAFLVASREGIPLSFPRPTHGEFQDGESADLKPFNNAWDAIHHFDHDVPSYPQLRVTGQWAELLASIPEGQNYLYHTAGGRGLKLFRHMTRDQRFLLKLAKNRPAWEISVRLGSAMGPFHWKNRRLSFEEMSAIQTFPADIRLTCGRTEAQRIIATAVPSLLTEILGRTILKQFFGLQREGGLRLMPQHRKDTPRRERVMAVPNQYRILASNSVK
jgi:DNA (cytosine-5)-methyltransferase 1